MMLPAALFHFLVGFVLGGLGFKAPVLVIYGMGNVILGIVRVFLTEPLWSELGRLTITTTAASIGYVIGAWLCFVLEAKDKECGADDDDERLPRLSFRRHWPFNELIRW